MNDRTINFRAVLSLTSVILVLALAGCQSGIKSSQSDESPSVESRAVDSEGEESEFDPPLYVDGALRMSFPNPVDVESFDKGASLTDAKGQVMKGSTSWNSDRTVMTFVPHTALEKENSYILRFPASAAIEELSIVPAPVSGVKGDVNGDGVPDFAVAEPAYKIEIDGKKVEIGAVYLYSGAKPADPAFAKVIGGGGGDSFGVSMSIVGDIDGDGRSDLMVGAPGTGFDAVQNGIEIMDNSLLDSGAVYFFSGKNLSGDVTVSQADAVIVGSNKARYRFGASISPLGDMNGDGYADVAIGEPSYVTMYPEDTIYPGAVYLFSGKKLRSSNMITGQDAYVKILGEHNGDCFGFSISGDDDVDGDGKNDLVVGAPIVFKEYDHYDSNGNIVKKPFQDGSIYVFKGSSLSGQNMSAGSALASIEGGKGFRFGWSVSMTGDVDGDGAADVLAGAPLRKGVGAGSGLFTGDGSAYLFSGKDLSQSTKLSDYKWRFQADGNSGSRAGYSVAGVGDVNGDGRDDVIVGAPGAAGGFPLGRGIAYVFGFEAEYVKPKDVEDPNAPKVLMFEPILIAEIAGAHAGDAAAGVYGDMIGWSVGGVGDIDVDGRGDVIVSAVNGEGSAGAVYFYSGKDLAGQVQAPDSSPLHGSAKESMYGLRVSGMR